jgi:hypothetical protein
MIQLHYSSADDMQGEIKKFPTVEAAGVWARKMLGDHPEVGPGYAVSGDGIAKVSVLSAGLRLGELFPIVTPESDPPVDGDYVAAAERFLANANEVQLREAIRVTQAAEPTPAQDGQLVHATIFITDSLARAVTGCTGYDDAGTFTTTLGCPKCQGTECRGRE